MAGNLLAAHKAVYAMENSLLPPFLFSEEEFLPKAGGMLYRLGKTVLLDNIMDHVVILIQHEVFGHGARYREYGSWDNSYHISLFPPFGPGSGWASSDAFSKTLSQEERILTAVAGNEANTLLSLRLRTVWLRRGKINFRETMLYTFAAQNITYYIVRTRIRGNNGGDITAYLSRINALHSGTGGSQSLDDLLWSCLCNLLDPFQYFALAGYFHTYLVTGEEYFALPMFDFGAFRYLPAAHFYLTPFGVEFYLDNYLKFETFLLYNYIRVGLPTFEPFFGAGFDVSGLKLTDWLFLHGRLDIWHQPAARYGTESGMVTGSAGLGVLAAVGADFMFTPKAGLTAQGGFKTDGFVPGKPLNNGFFFSAGLAFRE
jgi:hypothetical protein